MSPSQNKTQKRILDAALTEFVEHGQGGARMQHIADSVGVNKAMLHYYFDTKEKLFEEVFKICLEDVFGDLFRILNDDIPLFEKIERFISKTIDRLNQMKNKTAFIVEELNRSGDLTAELLQDHIQYDFDRFSEQLNEAASNYQIAPVEVRQVLTNILSLCLFPYVAKNMVYLLNRFQSGEEYRYFLTSRKGIVTDTVINWLAS